MECKAILIDAPTQGGKTHKCFEVISEKIEGFNKSLVLFVTQANSVSSVDQILQRVSDHVKLKHFHICRSKNTVLKDNIIIVDFWNTLNTNRMIEYVQTHNRHYKKLIIVIDEADQGNIIGIRERLNFISNVETNAPNTPIQVIFVTATVANLSKRILQISKQNDFHEYGIVGKILTEAVVEHQFAAPHQSYIGASWFLNNPDVWKELEFTPRDKETESKDSYIRDKENRMLSILNELPEYAKELSLVVSSNRIIDQEILSNNIIERSAYNVSVQLNNSNGKDLRMKYLSPEKHIIEWVIPFKQIYKFADRGKLKGIECKEDLTISHILQSTLFMNTHHQSRIENNTDATEFIKLKSISKIINRPDNYPKNPKVAIIAGTMAGRGITIQNPYIDFVCTSYCFTDISTKTDRGASNTQRFGRACGLLGDIFIRRENKPIMLSTKEILRAAIANEKSLFEINNKINENELIMLKSLVSHSDWVEILKEAQKEIKKPGKKQKIKSNDLIDGVDIVKFKSWMDEDCQLLVSKMVRYLYNMKGECITIERFKDAVGYVETIEKFESNIRGGQSVKSQYGKLWIVENGVVKKNMKLKINENLS